MMHIPAADPVLPSFPMLFDGEAMREMLSRHIAGSGDVEVTGVTPRYVRYKPQTSCLVGYDLDLRIGGETTRQSAHIRTFADDRGRRRMTNKKLARLQEFATSECGIPPLDWATYIPELNGLFSIFPVDYDLRPLLKVATASSAQEHLRDMLAAPNLEITGEPELIRYKPGRKALFRYEVQGRDSAIYGKIHAKDRGEIIRHATDSLVAAGMPTPPVLGIIPKLGFIAHPEVPGTQLASLRDDPRYSDLLAALAEPLSMLHRTPVDGLPVHHLGHEVDRLRETADLLGVVLPKQRERLQRIVRFIEDRLARIEDELATNHGDFYDDQAIVNGDAISIIDLDEIRRAHPLLDVGNMLAHLRTGAMRGKVDPATRVAFIDAMRAHRPLDDHDLATFEAIGVLKLAPGPFRRLEEGWPESIDTMLELIEALMGSPVPPDTGRAARSGVRGITDPKLPELPALQEVTRMQDHLREATGNPDLVLTGVHVQRHKQGRRAILRYDVKTDEPIWGKIFASKRGPRVYEITRMICESRAFGPDVTLPDPIAFLPDLRVLLQRSVPGASIDTNLFEADTSIGTRIADAIHALHASGLDLGREHDLDKELSPLYQRVEDVGALFPELRDEATALHARILDMAGMVQHWRFLPVHRDFYHDQVLANGDRLSVLDLDDAAMSEPTVDIANFAAHLDLLGLQQPAHERAIRLVRDRFIAHSRKLDPSLDDGLLALLTASTQLRLAGIHAPREDGRRVAAGLLAKAKELPGVISQVPGGGSPRR